ncbi:hypothetical protein GOM71_13625 [Paenibacillus sp. NEAU-GSW1]|nr:cyclic-phosphate processing receiver domain-containing protein [Paenibacillus sp. NEAU-GSW1]MUT66970.1 hypothetical protein [Paenibacillus sp. NEAU-GSW1]
MLKSGKVNKLSLDYNLGIGKPTGYKAVKYILDNRICVRSIVIHSSDRKGRKKMFDALQKHKVYGTWITIKPIAKRRF